MPRRTTLVCILALLAASACFAVAQDPVKVFIAPSGSTFWTSGALACSNPSPCPQSAPCALPASRNVTTVVPSGACQVIFLAGQFDGDYIIATRGPTILSTIGNVVATGYWQLDSAFQPISISNFTSSSFIGFASNSSVSAPISSIVNSNIVFHGQVTSSYRSPHLSILDSTLVFDWTSPLSGRSNGFMDDASNNISDVSYSTYIRNSSLSSPPSAPSASLQHIGAVTTSDAPSTFTVVSSTLNRITMIPMHYTTFEFVNTTWVLPEVPTGAPYSPSVFETPKDQLIFTFNETTDLSFYIFDSNRQLGILTPPEGLNASRLTMKDVRMHNMILLSCSTSLLGPQDIWMERVIWTCTDSNYSPFCGSPAPFMDHLNLTFLDSQLYMDSPFTFINVYSYTPSVPWNLNFGDRFTISSNATDVPLQLKGYYHIAAPSLLPGAVAYDPTFFTGAAMEFLALNMNNCNLTVSNDRFVLGTVNMFGWVDISPTTQFLMRVNASQPSAEGSHFNSGIFFRNNTFGLKLVDGPPQYDTQYELINYVAELPAVLTYVDFDNNGYNVTVYLTTTHLAVSFGRQTCSSRCPSENVVPNSDCYSTQLCNCVAPWSGHFCECNTTGLFGGLSCGSAGTLWVSDGDLSVTSSDGPMVVIPDGYDLSIDGDASISTDLVALNGSSISIVGRFSLSSTLEIHAKLSEVRDSNGCHVVSDVHVSAASLNLDAGSNVEILLDISALSTDGSCTAPSVMDPSMAVIEIGGGSAINYGVSFTAALVGGDNSTYSSLSFVTDLLASVDSGSSSGSVLNTNFISGSTTNCGSMSQSPGTVRISVGCTPPTSPPSPVVSGCSGPPPTTNAYCEGGRWIVSSPELTSVVVSNPGTVFQSPLEISGDFSVPSINVANVLSSSNNAFLHSNGCISIDQITVELSDDDVRSLESGSRSSLLSQSSCPPTTSSIAVGGSKPSKSCKKVKVESKKEGGSLSAIFSVDSSSCNLWWIILASVLGGLVVIILVVVLVVKLLPVCRKRFQPYYHANT